MTDWLASAGGVLRAIVDEATDFAIIVLDDRGRVEMWKAGAERIFRWKADEVRGRYFSFLFVPGEAEAGLPDRELERARESGHADDTRWHIRKDGTPVFVD